MREVLRVCVLVCACVRVCMCVCVCTVSSWRVGGVGSSIDSTKRARISAVVTQILITLSVYLHLCVRMHACVCAVLPGNQQIDHIEHVTSLA